MVYMGEAIPNGSLEARFFDIRIGSVGQERTVDMFTVSKNARIHESQASDKYSVAEIAAMKREGGGSKYYAFPFQCPVIGCGDTAPDEYDQTAKARFAQDDDYDVSMLAEDVVNVAETHGLRTAVNAFNRGIDLELRAKARPTPKSKMSANDKQAYIVGNHPDEARELIGQDQAAWIKWFDENIG